MISRHSRVDSERPRPPAATSFKGGGGSGGGKPSFSSSFCPQHRDLRRKEENRDHGEGREEAEEARKETRSFNNTNEGKPSSSTLASTRTETTAGMKDDGEEERRELGQKEKAEGEKEGEEQLHPPEGGGSVSGRQTGGDCSLLECRSKSADGSAPSGELKSTSVQEEVAEEEEEELGSEEYLYEEDSDVERDFLHFTTTHHFGKVCLVSVFLSLFLCCPVHTSSTHFKSSNRVDSRELDRQVNR